MKLTAIMPVRNEEQFLPFTLRALLRWVDDVVVLNHASVDGTAAILQEITEEYAPRVHVLVDEDPLWREMSHRQRLLDHARDNGATHIVTVDADEVLTANLVPRIRTLIEFTPPGHVGLLPWICLWRSLLMHRADPGSTWAHSDASAWFRDRPDLCWATGPGGYDHHHRHPINSEPDLRPVAREYGGLFHLQFVDWAHLRAKQALYKMEETLRWGPPLPDPAPPPPPVRRAAQMMMRRAVRRRQGTPPPAKPGASPLLASIAAINQRYDPAVNETGLVVRPVPPEWWAGYEDLPTPRFGGVSWQEVECRRLWQEHGASMFAGLDLFGVVP
jgi:hypothetical protein